MSDTFVERMGKEFSDKMNTLLIDAFNDGYKQGLATPRPAEPSFHLMRQISEIERKLIEWVKKNKYAQGDSYHERITKKGKWEVSYSNDYPMQHGGGMAYVLSEAEFAEAMGSKQS